MTRVRFHDAALSELAHEVEYYAKISPELGERFAAAVEQAVKIAAGFPEMGSPHKFATRRVFPQRFPFSVVYLHRASEIFVLAIAPDDRKPGYWKGRRVEG